MIGRKGDRVSLLRAVVVVSGVWLVTGGVAAPVAAPDALVSVWYRGTPAGVPRAADLEAFRNAGLRSITWPASATVHLAELRRLATVAGLEVLVRPAARPAPLPKGPAPDRFDLDVAAIAPGALSSTVWRTVAHGGRELSLDALTGPVKADGTPHPWLAPAGMVAAEVSRYATLIAALRAGPAIVFETPRPAALDVVLFDAGRSWAIVATNTSGVRVTAALRLPKGTPPAEWMNLLTSRVVAMVAKSDGPRWTCNLAPWQAMVLVIDKRPH